MKRLGAEVRTPHPRLGRRKLAASLGPTPACRKSGTRQGARRPRRRPCLLKGCEKPFRPTHPQARYCSPECREAARQWRNKRNRQKYRQKPKVRKQRQAQSQRYRSRCAEPAGSRSPGSRSPGSRSPGSSFRSGGVSPRVSGAGPRGSSSSARIRFFSLRAPRVL